MFFEKTLEITGGFVEGLADSAAGFGGVTAISSYFFKYDSLNGFLPPVDWVLWPGLSSPLLNRSVKEH